MVAVAISANGPTGTTEHADAAVKARLTHASDVDTATITLSLTDESGVAYAPLTLGSWLTSSGYSGIIKDVLGDGTAIDVVLTEHPLWIPGRWTATITADSKLGSNDGTLAWTFDVTSGISGALDLVKQLLEGRTGTTRTISSGEFHLFHGGTEEAGVSSAGPDQPFLLTYVGETSAAKLISGDHQISDHSARLTVLYDELPQEPLENERRITRDSYLIRRCLEWPDNWTGGLLGVEVSGIETELVETENGPNIVCVHHSLDLTIRERV